jgi:hypothetical protein
MTASTQDPLELVALEAGIARFSSRPPGHFVSVLDVTGAEASLATADEATQEELLAGRAQFLNAQTAPFQILVRAEPVDLDGHVRRVRARADQLREPLASVGREYASFVETLAQQHTLLERHCYVALPDVSPTPAATMASRIAGAFSRTRRRRSDDDSDTAIISAEVGRRLGARCDQLAIGIKDKSASGHVCALAGAAENRTHHAE